MDAIDIASNLGLSLVLWGAVASDLYDRKISNRLILLGIILSVILSWGRDGIANSFYVLRDIILPVVLFFLFFLCGVIGAGDIKLISVIGGLAGSKFAIQVMVLSFFIGAVWSLVRLIREESFRENMLSAFRYLESVSRGNRKPYQPNGAKRIEIPFSLAIYGGTVLSFLFQALF